LSQTFTIDLAAPLEAALDHARRVALANGVLFDGDESAGRFDGSGFSGSYRVEAEQVIITVDQKPFFVPWNLVESTLRDFFRPPPGSTASAALRH
jgi:hypothetical protein